MKTRQLYTLALMTTFAVPALADGETVLGCEVVDKGGYLNKADPTCVFSNEDARGARLVLANHDHDPATPDTLEQIDN